MKTTNTLQFFKDCKSLEEVKALYKKLAKENHPDHGGSTETMQELNEQYATACSWIFRAENLTEEETHKQERLSEEYRAVIEQIISLPNILIELVGNWIWVTGNTYPVKDKLKAAGLFFGSQKKAWYYRAEEYATKGGKKTLDEIRKKYGSETVNSSRPGKALKQ